MEREKERQGSGDEDEDEEKKYTELQRQGEDEKIRLEGLKLTAKKDVRKLDETGVFKKPNLSKEKKPGKNREGETSGKLSRNLKLFCRNQP